MRGGREWLMMVMAYYYNFTIITVFLAVSYWFSVKRPSKRGWSSKLYDMHMAVLSVSSSSDGSILIWQPNSRFQQFNIANKNRKVFKNSLVQNLDKTHRFSHKFGFKTNIVCLYPVCCCTGVDKTVWEAIKLTSVFGFCCTLRQKIRQQINSIC